MTAKPHSLRCRIRWVRRSLRRRHDTLAPRIRERIVLAALVLLLLRLPLAPLRYGHGTGTGGRASRIITSKTVNRYDRKQESGKRPLGGVRAAAQAQGAALRGDPRMYIPRRAVASYSGLRPSSPRKELRGSIRRFRTARRRLPSATNAKPPNNFAARNSSRNA